MSSLQNEQPLLEPTSDSDDVNEDAICEARQRNTGNASGSRYGHSNHSDINDSDTHDIQDMESNTDDFDDDTQQLFKASNTIPNDRFSFTYIVFYLLGTTTLLPWNFFITAEDVRYSLFLCAFLHNSDSFGAVLIFWNVICEAFHRLCVYASERDMNFVYNTKKIDFLRL